MFDANIDWKFQSELFLENFVWETLESLLNLKPLARQLYLSNQICDILTIDEKQQLTIVELKNTEDRYLIQQLTRYYAAIQEHQPFQE
jgi:RecB family endonuclease NucS